MGISQHSCNGYCQHLGHISEGSSNLYFTNERAQDAINSAISAGIQTGITITYDDTGNAFNYNVEPAAPYPFTTRGFNMPY